MLPCEGGLVRGVSDIIACPFAPNLKWAPLVLTLMCILGECAAARSAESGPSGTQPLLQPSPSSPAPASAPVPVTAASYLFDIVSQPLADALDAYGAVTGRSVFSDASVVAGRTAAAVRGVYAPEVALHMLLENTGLTMNYAQVGRTDAFVLRVLEPQPSTALPSSDGAAVDAQWQRRYGGLVQTRIWEAFCNIPLIEPGDYGTVVRFGVDPAGHVTDVRLLHGTGDRDRDAAVAITLQHVQLDAPPPPDLPQPIYMVILPRDSTPRRECAARP
jgi:TonB family protein